MRLFSVGLAMGVLASAAAAEPQLRPLITPEDYPEWAFQAHPQDSVRYALTIGNDGHVIGCTILKSSGDRDIDKRTCDILRRRAHFGPQQYGKVVQDQVSWSVYD